MLQKGDKIKIIARRIYFFLPQLDLNLCYHPLSLCFLVVGVHQICTLQSVLNIYCMYHAQCTVRAQSLSPQYIFYPDPIVPRLRSELLLSTLFCTSRKIMEIVPDSVHRDYKQNTIVIARLFSLCARHLEEMLKIESKF